MNRTSLLVGLGFGFLISASGMARYDVIHNALLLRELDMFFMMASAIAVALPLLWLLQRRRWQTRFGGGLDLKRYPIARKDILGSIVFGTGWAITGSCPGPALAMSGGGALLGLLVVAGLFTGLSLRDAVVARQEAEQARALAGASAAD